jgi:hypothetical protein
MDANFAKVMAEGSEEFREIISVLVQEKQKDGLSAVGPMTSTGRRLGSCEIGERLASIRGSCTD